MPNLPRPGPATPPLPTRRQLDELDALLQKMLDLPVQPVAEEPASEPMSDADSYLPPVEETHAPWSGLSEQPVLADDSPTHADEWMTDSPSIHPPSDVTAAPFSTQDSESVGIPPWTEAIRVAQVISEQNVPRAASADSEPRGASRPGFIRLFLGWLGIFCLIAALGILVLDWFGWPW
jgi:hypothetical protein